MIWTLAITPHELPRMHYYSLFNEDSPRHRESFLPLLLTTYMGPPGPEPEAVPEPHHGKKPLLKGRRLTSQRHQLAWTEANRFQYYWNAGLHTACWESRCVLLRYYEKQQQDLKTRYPSAKTKFYPGMFVTELPPNRRVAKIKEGPHTIYMDFSPRDIVCFRFPSEHLQACTVLQWEKLLTRLPFFQLPSSPNLAFEFEDTWDEGLEGTHQSVEDHHSEATVRGLVMRLHWAWGKGEIPSMTKIYLISSDKDLPSCYEYAPNSRRAPTFSNDVHEETRYSRSFDFNFSDGENQLAITSDWSIIRYETEPEGSRSRIAICNFVRKLDWLCPPRRRYPREVGQCLQILQRLPASHSKAGQ